MRKQIETLRGQRAKLIDEARTIVAAAEGENRDLTAEETQEFDRIEAESRSLKGRIDRLENLYLEDREDRKVRAGDDDDVESRADERKVPATLLEWKQQRSGVLPQDEDEYRSAFYRYLTARDLRDLTVDEQRALSKASAGAGANLVPTAFSRTLIESLRWMGSLRSLATVITTDAGETLQVPTVSAHGTASWVAENAAFSPSDETFGQSSLSAYKAATIIIVSEELLEDAAFDLEAYLRMEFSDRIGVLEETAYVVGDGTGKPTGITTQAAAGVTAASATAVTADELIDLMYAVPRQYRARGSFLVSDALEKGIRKLKDSDGQYLWQASLQVGAPDVFNGRPMYAHPDLATPAASAIAALFGDFRYYWIRDVNGVSFQRLNELYAANGQVGFRAYHRTDGKLMNTTAVRKLTMAAS